MTHDIASAALQTSGLHADHAGVLHREFKQHVETYAESPAGWHGADDIETLIGLEGSFQWFEGGLPQVMTFTFDVGLEGSQGSYVLSGAGKLEAGTFASVPNNPAIGWAFIALSPEDGPPRPIIVSGMVTDAEWNIQVALLNEVGQGGPTLPAFSAIRIAP